MSTIGEFRLKNHSLQNWQHSSWRFPKVTKSPIPLTGCNSKFNEEHKGCQYQVVMIVLDPVSKQAYPVQVHFSMAFKILCG